MRRVLPLVLVALLAPWGPPAAAQASGKPPVVFENESLSSRKREQLTRFAETVARWAMVQRVVGAVTAQNAQAQPAERISQLDAAWREGGDPEGLVGQLSTNDCAQALQAVLTAVNEVRPPIIVATLVVIVSFLPMFFITGMSGPYMRPMALSVPVAMLMSLVISFTVTPWMSYVVMRGQHGKGESHDAATESLTLRIYKGVVTPFLNHRLLAWGLIAITVLLLFGSLILPMTGRVPLKMLPFDNKSEFQVVVDMPEGSTLGATDAALNDLAGYACTAPEVTDALTFAGTSSPIDFNGLVRHYYLRHDAFQGDLRVNLAPKKERQQQSHEIVLRLRNGFEEIGRRHGARIKIVEVPPGPPVLSTIVAEVYSRPDQSLAQFQADATHIRRLFESEPGVVDVDDTFEANRPRYVFRIDKEKASLNGVSAEDIASTVRLALQGWMPGEGSPQTSRAGAAAGPPVSARRAGRPRRRARARSRPARSGRSRRTGPRAWRRRARGRGCRGGRASPTSAPTRARCPRPTARRTARRRPSRWIRPADGRACR